MKRRLLSLLAFTLGLVSSTWALEKDGDVYQIGTAQDLIDFAALVNSGEEMTANAVLTADIDMSGLMEDEWVAIGDWGAISGTSSAGYKGHFDGQGYTITGFNTTSCHTYYGIFGVIEGGAIVENFTVYGTMDLGHKTGGVVGYARDATIRNIQSYLTINVTEASTTAERPGGILGTVVNGTTVVENCTYSGTINVGEHTGNIGGIIGYVNNNTATIVNITNCLFDGAILNGSADGQCGGIVGYSNKGKVTIKNCLSIGTITTGTGNDGMFFGRLNTSNSKFDGENYYIGTNVNGTSSGASASGTAPTVTTTEQLASGEIAYALNGSQSENVGWFQKLGTDKWPTPYGSDIVYLTGHLHCDGTAYEGETTLSNTNESTKDEHIFVDGFCSYCDFYDASYMTPNTDGIYEIGTPVQLRWFAALVNTGGENMSANAVLTNDIDMEGVTWPEPIGYWVSDIGYKGHFDGQGYKIENLKYTTKRNYHGLFGVIWEGAIVENFSISGDVTNEAYDAIAPVAYSKNSVTPVYIRNIHSYLNITSSGNDKKVGGILGNGNNGTTYVDRCIFSGTLSSTNKTNCGGIVAYIQNNSSALTHITNCVFEGRIESTADNAYCGGIVGYIGANSAVYTITNCLSIGSFDAPLAGSIFGYVRNKGAGSSNNYIISGGITHGKVGDNCSSTDNLATEVTAEQLASGEVAYKLGEAWGQLLESDPYPTPSYDVKVSYVGEAGYATLYDTTTGYTLNGDVQAYVAVLYKTWLELTMIDNVPAGTPVILKGTYYNKVAADLNPINIANELKGTDVDTEADGSQYVLAQPEGEPVGFYPATTDIIPAGKAYYQSTSGVKAFFFEGEDATGIAGLNTQNTQNTQIFNIAGQRISKLQKGINIVGGKKILK
ncbi:MAG: hypothetical protein IKO58_00300 [Prevotella sp.]|nr:hypothetical protein [Prevotella sp.]